MLYFFKKPCSSQQAERSVSQPVGWTGVEILRDMKEKDEDGGMRRDSFWPQEAYPLLLLLLFYNELLKPSFPSLPWAEGVQWWGLQSLQPDSHAQAPRVAALSRVGGWTGQGCSVQAPVCVFETLLTGDRWGQNGFCICVCAHTCGHFSASDMCLYSGFLVRVWAPASQLNAGASFCRPETLNDKDNVGWRWW